MKHSIQRQIAVILALALVLAIALCAVLGYSSAYAIELAHGRCNGRSSAYLVETVVSESGIDALTDPANAELYETTRNRLRAICDAFYLRYIYIYTVDEMEVRHYIMTVAADDADDRLAAETLGLGTTRSAPLYEQERAALRGEESNVRMDLRNEYGTVITWITPYHGADGRVKALIGTDIGLETSNEDIAERFLNAILPVVIVLLAAFVALFVLFRKRVIQPLRTISERMAAFDPATEPEPMEIESQDEIRQIADAFEKMSGDIRDYLGNIERITSEQAHLNAQMDIARRIQYGMVPGSFHAERGRIDVSGSMQAAKTVGGDFYDSFFLENGSYCAVIGDVSGKGVSAALFMTMAKTMLRDSIKQGLSPAAALNRVNSELCETNPEGMFVTVFALTLNAATGEMRYANAGHNPPLLLRRDGAEWLFPDPGVALGLFEDAGIENGSETLSPGEGILLYTDGITEAVSADRRFYGAERLRTLLSDVALHGSAAAVEAVKTDVAAFSAGCEQFDDMTLLSLRRQEESDGERSLPVTIRSLDVIKNTVLGACGESKEAKQALLACDEAFSNIVSYSGAKNAFFACRREGEELTVRFRDDGVRFDPFAENAAPEKDFDELDSGGMGIRLIRQIASRYAWTYENGNNVLELTFKL